MTDAPLRPPPHPSELAEARAAVGEARALGFVARQRRARERVTLIEAFYLRYPCRMGSLHLLAVAAIALARFAGRSEAYDAIGARLVPVDANGAPRTQAWQVYTASFEEDLPPDVREERWLLAHLADMEAVKAEGWVGRFAAEREAHREDPSWRMLEEHMAVTLGARVHDGEALAGSVALETAMAAAFWALARRQVRTGLGLVRTYVFAAARAVILGGPRVPAHLPSDRRLVWRLCTASVRGLSAARVARLGWRRQARGAEAPGSAWSLEPSLRAVLGEEVEALHPDVRALFASMDRFQMRISVRLHHALGRWAAWAGALLMGQGMYESHLDEVPGRFRLFRREDGSLHFVREFWCEDAVRVFDSDFVVREVGGGATLLEVFQELGVAARMRTERTATGGLSMTVVGLHLRGVPVGVGPFRVRFTSEPGGDGAVDVHGALDLLPRGLLDRWFFGRLLRLPERVGEIRYRAERREATEAVPAG